MTRIGALSDIHGYLPEVTTEVDIFLIPGDLVPDEWNPQYAEVEKITKSMQGHWLKNGFSDWCENLPAKHVVVIAGNHDAVIMGNPGLMQDVSCIYLQDETIELEGLKIYGAPWTPKFGSWAFMQEDPNLAEKWDRIPEDVDILMTHGPAYGILDQTDEKYGSEHVGSASLRNKLDYGAFPNLKLHVFGHIHPAYGRQELERDNGDPITFANVTHVTPDYVSQNEPMVFDL